MFWVEHQGDFSFSGEMVKLETVNDLQLVKGGIVLNRTVESVKHITVETLTYLEPVVMKLASVLV